MGRQFRKTIVLLFLTLGSVLYSHAAIDTVKITTDDPMGLRDAIQNTAAGDTIVFASALDGDTIHIEKALRLRVNKKLTILGSGIDKTIISGEGNSRILHVFSTGDVIIKDVTITNGVANDIGGTLGTDGGAILNEGKLHLINSKIINSRTTVDGGAIFNSEGELRIESSQISNNIAGMSGGGIYNSRGELTVISSTISGNQGTFGGGIRSALSPNVASIINSVISGNRATSAGGGIYSSPGTGQVMDITNSTIAGNHSDGNGGGIFVSRSTMNIRSTIVAENTTGGTGPDIHKTSSPILNNQGNNLIGDNETVTTEFPSSLPLVGTSAGVADPDFVLSVPGPAPSSGGDLQLQSSSPAIDAGAKGPLTPALDIDKKSRQIGPGIDIGAYELGTDMPFDVSFDDPCSCSDAQNFEFNGVYYFHDVLTYTNAAADSVLLDSMATSDFFNAVGGAITLHTDSLGFTEVNDSTFVLDFWRASGPTVPSVQLIIRSGINYSLQAVPPATFLPSCDVSDCPTTPPGTSTGQNIPTVSEWGVIILLLAILIIGTVVLSHTEVATEHKRLK